MKRLVATLRPSSPHRQLDFGQEGWEAFSRIWISVRRPHDAGISKELSNIYEGGLAPKKDEKCRLPFLKANHYTS